MAKFIILHLENDYEKRRDARLAVKTNQIYSIHSYTEPILVKGAIYETKIYKFLWIFARTERVLVHGPMYQAVLHTNVQLKNGCCYTVKETISEIFKLIGQK